MMRKLQLLLTRGKKSYTQHQVLVETIPQDRHDQKPNKIGNRWIWSRKMACQQKATASQDLLPVPRGYFMLIMTHGHIKKWFRISR